MKSIHAAVVRSATPRQVTNCCGSVEKATAGYYVWTKDRSRKVSGRGDLEAEPQGEWLWWVCRENMLAIFQRI